jgi:uncharacterized protein involved in exopolysaccharide biosynthesis
MMDAESGRKEQRGFAAIVLPLVRSWRVVLAALVVAWTALIAWTLVRGHRFRAEAQLSTVSTTRSLPVTSGLAATLLGMGAGGGGVQLTPGLLVRIARMDGVLYQLGSQTLSGRGGRIVDQLAGKQVKDIAIERAMRRFVTAQFDVQTGVITVAVSHRDSALARAVLGRLVDKVSTTYREASRAQGREIRLAQQVRVDSAANRLHAAEESLSAFLARNRLVNEYTPEFVKLQALQREVETSNTVYTQALSDRDMAMGRELEETPAVVVLAGPPDTLPVERRWLALRLVLVTIVLVTLLWVALLGVDGLRRALAQPTPAVREAWRAAIAIPIVGRMLRWVAGSTGTVS